MIGLTCLSSLSHAEVILHLVNVIADFRIHLMYERNCTFDFFIYFWMAFLVYTLRDLRSLLPFVSVLLGGDVFSPLWKFHFTYIGGLLYIDYFFSCADKF